VLYSNLSVLVFSFVFIFLFLDFKGITPTYLEPVVLVAKGLFYLFVGIFWVLQCLSGGGIGSCYTKEKQLHAVSLLFQGTSMLVISVISYASLSCAPLMFAFQFIPGLVTVLALLAFIIYGIGLLTGWWKS
jgi:hypothetical protein